MSKPTQTNTQNHSIQTKSIAIIGGGWAGLAAAVSLCQQSSFKVTLFESAPQIGGRARAIEWNGMPLDNGQHLMIGAYQQMLQLLEEMQCQTDSLFQRLPHRLLMLDARTADIKFDLNLPTFPAPFHLLMGIWNNRQLSAWQKITLLVRFNRLLNTHLPQDISVSAWLEKAGLPQTYVDYILKPVCLAALTTHPHQASARAFQTVLQQTFNGPADFTDLLIPKADLSDVFPQQAETFIQQHGGEIHCRHKIKALQFSNDNLATLDIQTVDGQSSATFDHVILATSANVAASLLKPLPQTRAISLQLEQLQYESVSTLYLQFASNVSLQSPMIGVLNGTTEWIFERALSGQPNCLAIVISAYKPEMHAPENQDSSTATLNPAALKKQITARVLQELQTLIADLPQLIDSKLIVEKRAALQCHPDVDKLRPGTNTALPQLSLCGDYVSITDKHQANLPSTLEGALRSGVKCAQQLIETAVKV